MLAGVTGPGSSDVAPRRPVAAFFDLDKTIIARSSTLAFSRPFFDEGLINRRAVLKSSYAQFLFMLSGMDADQTERMRSHLAGLCGGWDTAQVQSIVAETLHDIVDPLVYAEAASLIAEHRAQGHDVVIVSASGDEVVGPIAEMVGADHHVATRMEVADGKYTGQIDFYCWGEGKAEAIRALADERGYALPDCHAYTDSVTDLPMLEVVGHPTAVNPDRALRREAVSRGWPVLTFSNPVSLRARIPTASRRTVTTAAVAVGAAVAGGAWAAVVRRGRRR
jgi:HAD superfamily hydrolase (TIGR01490 family)